MDLTPFLPVINIFGFLILGSAMIYTQWRLGANTAVRDGAKVGIEVISTYKEQVAQLREENQSLRNSLQDLTIKVTKLESATTEKDKKITELTLILTGKSPDQEEFMKRMDEFIKITEQFIQKSDEREEKIFTIIKNRQAYVVPLKEK